MPDELQHLTNQARAAIEDVARAGLTPETRALAAVVLLLTAALERYGPVLEQLLAAELERLRDKGQPQPDAAWNAERAAQRGAKSEERSAKFCSPVCSGPGGCSR